MGDRDPRLVLQLGPVEARDLHQVGEVERALDLVHLVLRHLEAGDQPGAHRARRGGRHLEPNGVAEAPAAELRLDGLEQVVGVVGELEVGVARDPEDGALGDVHAGEQHGQEVADHGLERHEPLADGHEPVETLRDLDPREPLLARRRVDREHAERQREPRDVRERLAGPDGERGQHRVDLALEEALQPLELPLRAVLDRHDRDALSLERRPQLLLPQSRLPLCERDDALADRGQRLVRCHAVGGANAELGRLLLDEAGHAHHEELVEDRREDGAELDALEQRLLVVGGEIEQALARVEPRQLAVDQARRSRLGLDRHGLIVPRAAQPRVSIL